MRVSVGFSVIAITAKSIVSVSFLVFMSVSQINLSNLFKSSYSKLGM